MPVAVARAPDSAALKAALVRVSILVASSPRRVQVSSRRFVQLIMIMCFPSSLSTSLKLPYSALVFDEDLLT